jgi:hypothetical protein
VKKYPKILILVNKINNKEFQESFIKWDEGIKKMKQRIKGFGSLSKDFVEKVIEKYKILTKFYSENIVLEKLKDLEIKMKKDVKTIFNEHLILIRNSSYLTFEKTLSSISHKIMENFTLEIKNYKDTVIDFFDEKTKGELIF